MCKSAKRRGIIRSDASARLQKIHIATSGYAPWSGADIQDVSRSLTDRHRAAHLHRTDVLDRGAHHRWGSCRSSACRPRRVAGFPAKQDGRYVICAIDLSASVFRFQMGRSTKADARNHSLYEGWADVPADVSRHIAKCLGNVINEQARTAQLVDRTAHGLRKARLILIAETGGSAHAIMAWGGHWTFAEAQRYTRGAELKHLVLEK